MLAQRACRLALGRPGGEAAEVARAMNEQQRICREKLRWHCRRALLELDIVFQRFWASVGDELDEATADVLERLLELEDHELWELVSGRSQSNDPQLQGMADRLRALGAAGGRSG